MPRRTKSSDKSSILALDRLVELDREALVITWQRVYGCAPPFKISRQLLLHAIAYKMQEQVGLGLKPTARHYLEQVAISAHKGDANTTAPAARTGTRLLREWHGATYEATIVENGVLFQGQQYKSLSEVARIITGTAWSGPLFFGLKKNLTGKGKPV